MKKAIILLLIIGLWACEQQEAGPSESNDTIIYCEVGNDDCESENNLNYADIVSSETFIHLDFKEAIALLNDGGSGIFYFGYPDCPWCLEALPVMKETADRYEQKIYYVATRDSEKNALYSEEEADIILKYVGAYEDKDEQGNLHLYVPLVVKIENGKAVAGNLGTVESHDAHERRMTSEELSQLTQIYSEMFK